MVKVLKATYVSETDLEKRYIPAGWYAICGQARFAAASFSRRLLAWPASKRSAL
jgi:hypothetical protein